MQDYTNIKLQSISVPIMMNLMQSFVKSLGYESVVKIFPITHDFLVNKKSNTCQAHACFKKKLKLKHACLMTSSTYFNLDFKIRVQLKLYMYRYHLKAQVHVLADTPIL